MPRYDEMDDLLRQVRARLGLEEIPTESQSPAIEVRPAPDAVQQSRLYERVMTCTEALLHDAEALRALLSPNSSTP